MNDDRPAAGPGVYPDSWYPACVSRQVRRKRPFAVRVLGMEWVIFRDTGDRLAVVQRFCCHMGTDLARGQVDGDVLRCPLHHWCFGRDGRCVAIPGVEKIPERAELATLECMERFGIVFVAHGPGRPFGFPGFVDINDVASSRPRFVPMQAPYVAVSLNLFDMQHLTTVHQRGLREPAEMFSEGPSHIGIRFSAYDMKERFGNRVARWFGMSARNIRVDCWGGNLSLISIDGRRPNIILALAPVDERSCRLYLATADEREAGLLPGIARAIKLELATWLTRLFVSEDIRILSNARTSAGILLADRDAEAIKFWEYFDDLPRSNLLDPR